MRPNSAASILTPKTLKTSEALEEFRAHDADAAVVVAYGMILPQAILDAPKLGCFNLDAEDAQDVRSARGISRARCRCRRRGRLRHDPAAGHSRCAQTRLLQSSRL